MSHASGMIIVNADDFGYSKVINRAIMNCLDRGLISSTTIMANMPGFEEACELAISSRYTDCVGIHLNLTEGRPLLPDLQHNSSLCDASGQFRRFRPRMLSKSDRGMIAAEVEAQILRCRRAGLQLTHADSHQHVHNEPLVLMAIQPVLTRLGIRNLRISRNMDPLPVLSPKRLAKEALNRWISILGFRRTNFFGTVANFQAFRAANRLSDCSFEIMTHPFISDDGALTDHVDELPLADRLELAFKGLKLSSYAVSSE
ncbi:MAG: ChbG/HpnK family deacetylase [Planctomycetaceae bacterium]